MLNSEKVGLARSQALINHYDGQGLGCFQLQSDGLIKKKETNNWYLIFSYMINILQNNDPGVLYGSIIIKDPARPDLSIPSSSTFW